MCGVGGRVGARRQRRRNLDGGYTLTPAGPPWMRAHAAGSADARSVEPPLSVVPPAAAAAAVQLLAGARCPRGCCCFVRTSSAQRRTHPEPESATWYPAASACLECLRQTHARMTACYGRHMLAAWPRSLGCLGGRAGVSCLPRSIRYPAAGSRLGAPGYSPRMLLYEGGCLVLRRFGWHTMSGCRGCHAVAVSHCGGEEGRGEPAVCCAAGQSSPRCCGASLAAPRGAAASCVRGAGAFVRRSWRAAAAASRCTFGPYSPDMRSGWPARRRA